MILFTGLGFVTWKSATLVSRLNTDLGKAEQAIAQLHIRFQNMDTDVIVERLVNKASEQLGTSIRTTLKNIDLAQPIAELSDKIAITQKMVGKSSDAMQRIQEEMSHLDNDEIAKRVSCHVIKGLGDGLQKAADDRLSPVEESSKVKIGEIVEDK